MFWRKKSEPSSPKPSAVKTVRTADSSQLVNVECTENCSTKLHTSIALGQFSWLYGSTSSSWVTEARTFYLISDSGELFFLQFAYSNTGWPMQASCQVSLRVFDSREATFEDGFWCTMPERGATAPMSLVKANHNCIVKGRWNTGRHLFEAVNASASKMKISPGGTSTQIKDTYCIFESPDPVHCLKVDVKTNGLPNGIILKHNQNKLDVQMEFEVAPYEGVGFGDGNIAFGEGGSDGTINMKFLPFGRVSGFVEFDGTKQNFEGRGLCIHQFQGIRPNLIATRWNLAYFVADKQKDGESKDRAASFFMIQVRTPSTYGSVTVNYGICCNEERLIALTTGDNKISPFSPRPDPVSGYYVPEEILYEWNGKTFTDEPISAKCRVQPKKLCSRINVLDCLPFLMRKIVEAMVTKPYVFQWLDRAEVSVSIGKSTQTLNGWIFQEISYLSDEM